MVKIQGFLASQRSHSAYCLVKIVTSRVKSCSVFHLVLNMSMSMAYLDPVYFRVFSLSPSCLLSFSCCQVLLKVPPSLFILESKKANPYNPIYTVNIKFIDAYLLRGLPIIVKIWHLSELLKSMYFNSYAQLIGRKKYSPLNFAFNEFI